MVYRRHVEVEHVNLTLSNVQKDTSDHVTKLTARQDRTVAGRLEKLLGADSKHQPTSVNIIELLLYSFFFSFHRL